MTAQPRLAVAIVITVGLTCAAGRASGDPPPAAPRPITVPLERLPPIPTISLTALAKQFI